MIFKLDGQTTQMMADALRVDAEVMREAAKQLSDAPERAAALNERADTFTQVATAIAGKEIQLTVDDAANTEVRS